MILLNKFSKGLLIFCFLNSLILSGRAIMENNIQLISDTASKKVPIAKRAMNEKVNVDNEALWYAINQHKAIAVINQVKKSIIFLVLHNYK